MTARLTRVTNVERPAGEGTVAVHLRLGDAAGARAVLKRLRGTPGRGSGDMRGQLLTASVAAAEEAQRPPVAQR